MQLSASRQQAWTRGPIDGGIDDGIHFQFGDDWRNDLQQLPARF